MIERTSGAEPRPKGSRSRFGWIVGVTLLLAGGLRWAVAMPEAMSGYYSIGDLAIIELAVIEAAEDMRSVGQPTRFGFFQPGPAMFYVLAPLYVMTGGERYSLSLTPFMLALSLGILAAVGLTRWYEPKLGFALCGLFFAFFIAYCSTHVLFNYWNAFLIILPAALVPVLAARVGSGHAAVLPWLVGLDSYLVQAYSSPAPAVLAVTLFAAARLLWLRLRGNVPAPAVRRSAMATLCVLALFWGLPLYEEFGDGPGNLTKIVEAALAPAFDLPEPRAVAAATARELASPWLRAITGSSSLGSAQPGESMLAWLMGAIFLVSLPGALLVARRRRWRFTTELCVVVLLGVAVASVSMLRLSGGLHRYIYTWLGGWAAIGWGTVGAVALDRLPALERLDGSRIAMAILAAVGIFLLLCPPRFPAVGDRFLAGVISRAQSVAATFEESDRPIHLVAHDRAESWVSGLLIGLHRRGLAARLVNLPAAGPYWKSDGVGRRLHFSTLETPPEDGLTLLSCHAVTPLGTDTGRLCMFARSADFGSTL